ncbi:hypothetical protein B566_EDAN002041 [Ephemera danica]|nr:hypothetical protein B566_EDAN002041 [Ephemera danica]
MAGEGMCKGSLLQAFLKLKSTWTLVRSANVLLRLRSSDVDYHVQQSVIFCPAPPASRESAAHLPPRDALSPRSSTGIGSSPLLFAIYISDAPKLTIIGTDINKIEKIQLLLRLRSSDVDYHVQQSVIFCPAPPASRESAAHLPPRDALYNDEEWVKTFLLAKLENREKYKLCLQERDFKIGESILENIMENILCSRHAILVISPNFVANNMCQWELKLIQRSFDLSPSFLILIELERLTHKELPTNLRLLMGTRTYLEWTTQNESRFWERLKLALGNPIRSSQSEPTQDFLCEQENGPTEEEVGQIHELPAVDEPKCLNPELPHSNIDGTFAVSSATCIGTEFMTGADDVEGMAEDTKGDTDVKYGVGIDGTSSDDSCADVACDNGTCLDDIIKGLFSLFGNAVAELMLNILTHPDQCLPPLNNIRPDLQGFDTALTGADGSVTADALGSICSSIEVSFFKVSSAAYKLYLFKT